MIEAPQRRGAMEGATSPYPLADRLPAIFRAALERAERRALRMRADGASDAEIAKALDLPVERVARIVAEARTKLGLLDEDDAEAAARVAADDFLERLCGALDDVLAPVLVTLDALDVYLDPELTPDDFLDWLGGWVALGARLRWPEETWRQLIAESARLFKRRGTADALTRFVELYSGGGVEVYDPGAVTVAGEDEGASAGDPTVVVTVRGGRIRTDDAAAVAALEHVVSEAMPVHLTHRVEVFA